MTCFSAGKVVCVPGVMVGTVGTGLPLAWCEVAADAWFCRPDREMAAAPVPRPTALLKVRLLII